MFTFYSNASIFSQVSTKLEEANFHKKFFSGLTVKYHEINIGDGVRMVVFASSLLSELQAAR